MINGKVQFCTPPPKKSSKNPNQKWAKYRMKAPIRQVLLQASLFVVHFSKRYIDFFNEKSALNGRICDFCEISFKCYINQLLEYRDLTKVTAEKLLTNFTFVLQKISEFESDRAMISSRTSPSKCLEKIFLEMIRKKFLESQT